MFLENVMSFSDGVMGATVVLINTYKIHCRTHHDIHAHTVNTHREHTPFTHTHTHTLHTHNLIHNSMNTRTQADNQTSSKQLQQPATQRQRNAPPECMGLDQFPVR